MTVEDFHALLDADPSNHGLRLLLAEAMDEAALDVECVGCTGRPILPYRTMAIWIRAEPKPDATVYKDDPENMEFRCRECNGSGTVSDGRRELAEGYRAMGRLERYPHKSVVMNNEWSWFNEDYLWERAWSINRYWFLLLVTGIKEFDLWIDYPTRREAEDAAALAFSRLTPDQQEAVFASHERVTV